MSPVHETLAALAESYGVATSYVDGAGQARVATPETLVAVLRALGAELEKPAAAGAALAAREAALAARVLEPVIVAWDGELPRLRFWLPASAARGRWRVEVSGDEVDATASGSVAELPVVERRTLGAQERLAREAPLGFHLPLGYHALRLELGRRVVSARVIAAPRQAHVDAAVGEQRAWGVFAPLYALHGRHPHGVADYGDLAQLLDTVAGLGGNFVGTLPLLPVFLDELFAPSPYSPVSRLFWNELFIDLDAAVGEAGTRAARELLEATSFARELRELSRLELVDYRETMQRKRQVLQLLAAAAWAGPRRAELEAFVAAQPWVDDYARFRAVTEARRVGWGQWPARLRDGRLEKRDFGAEAWQYHVFVQELAARQLVRLADQGEQRQVGLYLDLALGVHPDGFDTWRQRQLFLPGLAAGAPPDALSTTGQNWGFPGLHPEAIRADGHAYLAACVRHHARVARALRLDHVMGLHRLFLVPDGSPARDGVYLRYPADELYAVLCLESARHGCVLVGEDLGTVPPEVRPALAEHRIHRIFVSQFELHERPFDVMAPPPRAAFASFDTHDTATFAGFWSHHDLALHQALGHIEAADAERERQRRDRLRELLTNDLRQRGLWREQDGELALFAACLRRLAVSDAASVMVTLEDLWLDLDAQNVPGTVEEHPNWRRRMKLGLAEVRARPELTALLREVDTLRQEKSMAKQTSRPETVAARSGGEPPPPLTADDLFLFNEGTHNRLYLKLGAHPGVIDGVAGTRFAVWAPDAESIAVVGDFNNWNPDTHFLAPRESSGIWEGFIPGVGHGDLYKYHVRSRYHGYRADKSDPFGRTHEVPPRTASRVWRYGHAWGDQEWMARRAARNGLDAPVSIYEVHLGSFMRVPEEGGRALSYRELADRLVRHVKEIGFTHVELMPVMEHPFGGSWGYQVTGYFAPTSRQGTPDDLMYLIDQLHQNDIGVILDWVPAHFPTDGHGLAYFDGTHLYEHADARQGFHPDWHSYIFNYGRKEVRSFLLSSAMCWLDVFHADGLRVDGVASMLYLDYSRRAGEWIPNQYGGRENLEAISFVRQLNEMIFGAFPDAQTIAEESTDWPAVSRPTYVGGLGFGLKWDMGWMHDTLRYMSHEPVHRKYHHHELTFRMLYAYTENFVLPLSHDEVVHGKGSLLGKMPGDMWQKFANLRLLYAYMYAQPGKKLLFMGGEIGQWTEWNHETSVEWHLLDFDTHRGVRQLVVDLNRIYRTEPALHEQDVRPEGFEWIDCHDQDASIYTFVRRSRTTGDLVLVACNMTPVPRWGYRAGVPRGGFWQEILNTDASVYGGSGLGNAGGVHAADWGHHGRPHSVELVLPPLAAVFLVSRG